MAALVTMILSKIAASIAWIGALFVAIFAAAWFMLTDVVVWAVDQAMGVAVGAAGSIDTSAINASVGTWAQVPVEVVNILLLLRVPEAIAIITAAIGIRVVLQLIPFVRLGS